jgi:hypothetical protein
MFLCAPRWRCIAAWVPAGVPHERSTGYVAACGRRMAVQEYCANIGRDIGTAVFRAKLRFTNQGRLAVNLALKWDVIAVCAVFVFVGAVLLGAF